MSRWSAGKKSAAATSPPFFEAMSPPSKRRPTLLPSDQKGRFVKILVANLGSTSLKWRLFDCSDAQERLLHKGGFERVTHYAKAIEDCLGELKSAGVIQSEGDLAAVGFKTI